MRTRPFDEIPIADFARAAKVSIGSFYFRFPSKDVFLLYLGERLLLDVMAPSAAANLAPAKWKGTTLYEKIHGYFSYAAGEFKRHRSVMRPLSLMLDQMREEPLRKTANAFNATVHGAFKTLVFGHKDEFRVADPDQAVDDILFWASAAVRQLTLYREQRPKAEEARVIREISMAAVAYLTASQNAGRTKR